MNQSDKQSHFPPGRRFAFGQSGWHRDIVDQGRDAFLAEMARRGVPAGSFSRCLTSLHEPSKPRLTFECEPAPTRDAGPRHS